MFRPEQEPRAAVITMVIANRRDALSDGFGPRKLPNVVPIWDESPGGLDGD